MILHCYVSEGYRLAIRIGRSRDNYTLMGCGRPEAFRVHTSMYFTRVVVNTQLKLRTCSAGGVDFTAQQSTCILGQAFTIHILGGMGTLIAKTAHVYC
jgi:hypothetical protein